MFISVFMIFFSLFYLKGEKIMEEYKNEKYQQLENVEDLFRRINGAGDEFNYCFGASVPPSLLSTTLLSMGGAVGGLIEAKRQKNKLTGFIVNKNEKGICLVPLVLDSVGVMQLDTEGYLDIKNEEIESVKIKSVDFSWKKVTITLHDQRKIVMHVAKKIKGFDFHKGNFQKFMEIYSK